MSMIGPPVSEDSTTGSAIAAEDADSVMTADSPEKRFRSTTHGVQTAGCSVRQVWSWLAASEVTCTATGSPVLAPIISIKRGSSPKSTSQEIAAGELNLSA